MNRTNHIIRLFPLIAAFGLLTACGDDPEPVAAKSAADATAEGDVLPGSISDAMLPLDTVTSTSPSLAPEEGKSDDSSGEDDSGEEESSSDSEDSGAGE